MRKYGLVETTKQVSTLLKVSCDYCGKEFDKDAVIRKTFGRMSIKFCRGHGCQYKAEICNDCFDEQFKSKMRYEEIDYI